MACLSAGIARYCFVRIVTFYLVGSCCARCGFQAVLLFFMGVGRLPDLLHVWVVDLHELLFCFVVDGSCDDEVS